MIKSLIVVDDFYNYPTLVRDEALDAEYEVLDENNQPNYAGRNSINHFGTQGIDDVISSIIGYKVVGIPSSAHGHFRIQQNGDSFKQNIHVDFPNFRCSWAGVIYLSPNELCRGKEAVSFYRHKRLGIEIFPKDTQAAGDLGFYGPNDLRDFMYTDGMDYSLWDKTSSISNVFNRLVLFRSNHFHAPGQIFGDSMETGRLIQTLFFEDLIC